MDRPQQRSVCPAPKTGNSPGIVIWWEDLGLEIPLVNIAVMELG